MEFVEQRGLFDEELIQLALFGETKKRVLIEGGFQDDWGRLNSVHTAELVIGDDVTKINIRCLGSSYIKPLTLVYRWEGVNLIPVSPLEKGNDYNLFDYNRLQAVSSIIVDDGRVFFDISLLKDRSERNYRRLDIFLERLKEKTDGTNPVNLFFNPNIRQRFMHTQIEIYDFR